MKRHRRWIHAASFACWLGVSLACTPALNWRTVVVPGGQVTTMFPCRPDLVERPVRVADRTVSMRLMACRAAESTFALAMIDVSDSSAAEAVLADLRKLANANIGGRQQAFREWLPKGAASAGERLTVLGHWPDGAALVEERATVVVNGTLYRLNVIGDAPSAEAVDNFVSGFAVAGR